MGYNMQAREHMRYDYYDVGHTTIYQSYLGCKSVLRRKSPLRLCSIHQTRVVSTARTS